MRRIAGLIGRVVRDGIPTAAGEAVIREAAAEVREIVAGFPPYPLGTELPADSALAR
jgi:glycine hydroxymethyltransferase